MPSTFFGLEIGVRSLAASQLALDVVGQNTANVGTPGYSRQVAVFQETEPYGGPGTGVGAPSQLGTGVSIASVDRVRDQYVDSQVNAAVGQQGALTSLQGTLSRVEAAFGEPSATGVGSQLTTFLSSFSNLSASPESGGVRATVINSGEALANAYHTVSGALTQIGPDIQSKITSDIGVINNLADQIATLNKQIGTSIAVGEKPNDLLDKRTALVKQISGLVNVQVINEKSSDTGQLNNKLQLNVGGFPIVQSDSSNALPSTVTSANGALGLVNSDGQTIPLQSGEVYGLIKSAVLVSGYQKDLDTLASNVITAVNAQHATGAGLDGVSGRTFFTGTGAADIDVAPAIKDNPDAIAAATAPTPPATVAPGNGDNASKLAALTSQPVIGSQSMDQYYNAKVAGIGADSQQFQAEVKSQSAVLAQLQNQQSSVSGVNLDEELTKMLQYQRSYQAAARMVNVQDDILNTIINGLGSAASTTGG